MKKNVLIVGFIILIGILLVVLVNNQKSKNSIHEVEYANLNNTLSEYKEGLIFIPFDDETNELSDYFINEYKLKIIKSKMSIDELDVLIKAANLEIESKKPMYLIFDEGKIIGGFDANLSKEEANDMFRYYVFNEIPNSLKQIQDILC